MIVEVIKYCENCLRHLEKFWKLFSKMFGCNRKLEEKFWKLFGKFLLKGRKLKKKWQCGFENVLVKFWIILMKRKVLKILENENVEIGRKIEN